MLPNSDNSTPMVKTGPGALLTTAREAKGLDIAVLASALRMPVDRLLALESEQWSKLPDMGFARSLAMSVCRHLGLDPKPVLAGMPNPIPSHFARVSPASDAPLGVISRGTGFKHRIGWGVGLVLLVLSIWVAWGIHGDPAERPSATVEVPRVAAPSTHIPVAQVPSIEAPTVQPPTTEAPTVQSPVIARSVVESGEAVVPAASPRVTGTSTSKP